MMGGSIYRDTITIRGDYIKWFRSYLTDRTQYVNFNGEESAEHTLKCGVPQGSILGPLFFIIFF